MFDRLNTPSTVGVITEHFRRLHGVERSDDPIFSICAKGADQSLYVDARDYYVFGSDSFFEDARNNVTILGLGCPMERGGHVFSLCRKNESS